MAPIAAMVVIVVVVAMMIVMIVVMIMMIVVVRVPLVAFALPLVLAPHLHDVVRAGESRKVRAGYGPGRGDCA
jgi:hypothetical protein